MTDPEWQIAKITDTFLGFEDHGMLSCSLSLDYGGAGQGTPMFSYGTREGETETGGTLMVEHIAGILGAAGVDRWEKLKGRTIMAYADHVFVYGLKPLPTEQGQEFWFRHHVEVFQK